ncbi:hypothetical protein HK096_000283, partial [Nowakowskiella sp. JEL0078]
MAQFWKDENKKERMSIVEEWNKKGGVMLITYDLFRILTRKVCAPGQKETVEEDAADLEEEIEEDSARLFYEYLVNPGPALVIADEGHKLKNPASLISSCVSKIFTPSRIILTGTPLQNNIS